MNKGTIPASDEAWEDGLLGKDENFVGVVSAELTVEVDEAAGTQLVSIRMQKSMIDDLKAIAAANGGMGYQTLIKQQLQRFVDSEKKQVWNEYISQQLKGQQRAAEQEPKQKSKQRKAA